MNTAILLSATFFLVSSTPVPQPNRQILENIIKDLNVSLPESLKNRLVPDVMKKECHLQYEDFCKAEKVLLEIEHNMKNWTLVRSLHLFNQKRSCSIEKDGNELQLKDFLRHLLLCARKIYANLSNN